MDFTNYINDFFKFDADCVRCIDANTFKLDIHLRYGTKISNVYYKLFGIKIIESKYDDTLQFLKNRVEGKRVYLYAVTNEDEKNSNHECILITKAYNDNPSINVNQELIEKGYANFVE